MVIGILKEEQDDNRVAMLPEQVKKLVDTKISMIVEHNAGTNAFYDDNSYTSAGASVANRDEILKKSDLLLTVNAPGESTIAKAGPGSSFAGIFNPLGQPGLIEILNKHKVTSFSMDLVPRITRAQSMDVLSSMASVAGYRAVLDAARHLPGFFPMFMSAAGTIKPSKLLVLGAGVAGLQAIATARKLGAVVEVFDVRSAVKEEVMSLGAKFIEVEGATEDSSAGGYAVEQDEDFKRRQSELIQQHAQASDVIICTAQIPGRKAPLLLKGETVEKMKKGSVIIDLAASTGGNCELTQNDEIIRHKGVTIIGESNYASTMPDDASRMYGNNMLNFTRLLYNDQGEYSPDFEDEIVSGTCLTRNGQLVNERVKSLLSK